MKIRSRARPQLPCDERDSLHGSAREPGMIFRKGLKRSLRSRSLMELRLKRSDRKDLISTVESQLEGAVHTQPEIRPFPNPVAYKSLRSDQSHVSTRQSTRGDCARSRSSTRAISRFIRLKTPQEPN